MFVCLIPLTVFPSPVSTLCRVDMLSVSLAVSANAQAIGVLLFVVFVCVFFPFFLFFLLSFSVSANAG